MPIDSCNHNVAWCWVCRLCEPYITDDILKEAFGQDAASKVQAYMTLGPHGRYNFRPEYDRCCWLQLLGRGVHLHLVASAAAAKLCIAPCHNLDDAQ